MYIFSLAFPVHIVYIKFQKKSFRGKIIVIHERTVYMIKRIYRQKGFTLMKEKVILAYSGGLDTLSLIHI